MKLPVIRGYIGDWAYYTGVMRFKDVAKLVEPSVQKFCNPSCLSDLLQRNLTENYMSIKDYILNDKQRFFNAIVLAIYDGTPKWLEVEFDDEFETFNNVGFLSLDENIRIFPVDGQHRVKGIIEAISENEDIEDEMIPVIIIGHKDDTEGKRRTRKLFSTLNRRAKPVGNNYEIALDEDDLAAIVTRELIEECALFQGKRLCNNKGKQIPVNNVDAFTSLIALYQCNDFLLKSKLGMKDKEYKNSKLYRPDDTVIKENQEFIISYWESFIHNISVVNAYMHKNEDYAKEYRSSLGGNLLFRPIGLIEFVKASYCISERDGISIEEALQRLNKVPVDIANRPWKGIVWDGKKIITRVNLKLLNFLILFTENNENLNESDRNKMVEYFMAATGFEGSKDEALKELLSCINNDSES